MLRTVIGATLVQLGCGVVNGFISVLATLDTAFYANPLDGRTLHAYYVAMGVFALGVVVVGVAYPKLPPARWVGLGAALVALGYGLTAIGVHTTSTALVLLGYGVIHGLGLGLCYGASFATAFQRCHDCYLGLCGGLLAAAFGVGSIVGSKALLPATTSIGRSSAFLVVGGGVTAVLLLGSACFYWAPPTTSLDAPKPDDDEPLTPKAPFSPSTTLSPPVLLEVEEPSAPSLWSSPLVSLDYAALLLLVFGYVVYGVTMLPRYPLLLLTVFGQSRDAATRIIVTFGLYSILGRLLGGGLADVLSRCIAPPFARKLLLVTALLVQVLLLYKLPETLRTRDLDSFEGFVRGLNVCFGVGFGIFPSFAHVLFGAPAFAKAYSGVVLAWVAALLIGGLSFGASLEARYFVQRQPIVQVYDAIFAWLRVLTLVGLVAGILVRTNPHDRFATGVKYQVSVCGRPLLRCGVSKPDPMV
ncbi:hypothetical protein SDRG_02854 [Saprolegnia diclina VS20]|uniref:Major facilitator superfamily (MFS) profile domain-containing protein n=1 Tax=Saprolegnia diclina (strain VS20) TaxID=1156394 RepID=T0QZS1_SAPDV|nr:hypothetical protein SDRG_02854 [Saprolegnia diclina VS20]EQC40206.1 hypothetical protein SDRG_02854 [Saprolegnia diclina VS20]|eukprot:XP_008606680.1 hypothetical protein SDRG_02854 [Saprolegnia diclina VS20]